jgi:transcriptional regulator with XRE-family HTH domain
MARTDARGLITEIRERSGLSPTPLRIRSGVSRATQRRIDTGESDVTLGTLRELAIAAGFDIDLGLVPLSDAEAAAGARALLDDTVDPNTVSRAADAWSKRLLRLTEDPLRETNNPLDIIAEAGRAAAPLNRDGALLFRGEWNDLKLADAGMASRAQWLLSGMSALTSLSDEPTPIGGIGILYSADPVAVTRHLVHLRPSRPSTANLVILPITESVTVDSWQKGPLQLVSPIQAIIDGIGVGGTTAEIAVAIARKW